MKRRNLKRPLRPIRLQRTLSMRTLSMPKSFKLTNRQVCLPMQNRRRMPWPMKDSEAGCYQPTHQLRGKLLDLICWEVVKVPTLRQLLRQLRRQRRWRLIDRPRKPFANQGKRRLVIGATSAVI
ncbi:MAG TPA: hypothetical protein EYG57_14235 [Planctomycetes bacterium]|nr:hypothetical protein [Planctomycetota bacterium]